MGKTVVVTGGAKGIGEGISRAFAEKSWNVVFTYLSSKQRAEALASETGAVCVKCDVRNPEETDALYSFATEKFGKIDVLINNAGISSQKLFTDITNAEWKEMFDVNVNGVFNTSQSFARHFINNKDGAIINISSMWGQVGASCEVHYSASKAAVIGFTKALAKELAPSNVRVNCIAPGVIMTDMMNCFDKNEIEALKNETPLLKLGTPEDVARAAIYLAEDTFTTGQILSPNGGFVI